MSDKKQIEEMANDIAKICPDLVESGCGQINCVTHLTLSLYNASYRKQIEGEWLLKWESTFPQYEPSKYQCSICGSVRTARYEYCPNCGAKMKGGAE